MASRSDTFISTWLKISIILSICGFYLLFFSLFGNGSISLCTWLANLCVVVLNGIEWIDTWLSTLFPDLNVWTILHWLNYWSSIRWTWLEFLGFLNCWLGKVSLGLSLCELASWLIWTSNLIMACAFCNVCMRDSWFLIYLSIVFSKSVIFFSSGGLWKEDCGAWLE